MRKEDRDIAVFFDAEKESRQNMGMVLPHTSMLEPFRTFSILRIWRAPNVQDLALFWFVCPKYAKFRLVLCAGRHPDITMRDQTGSNRRRTSPAEGVQGNWLGCDLLRSAVGRLRKLAPAHICRIIAMLVDIHQYSN